jgi:putative flippase GtrA
MISYKTYSQYAVFLTGSGLGAAIDYVLTLGFVHGFEIELTTALAIAMCISALAVFVFHHRFTFCMSEETTLAAMLFKFFVLAVVVYGLRVLFLWLTDGLMPISIQLALSFCAASLINFLVSKMIIFKS